MKTYVVNIRVEKCEVYIGRGSEWGNPYIIGRDGDRDEVISKYGRWMKEWDIKKIEKARRELKGKSLGCYCKPLACHGDLLVELVEAER